MVAYASSSGTSAQIWYSWNGDSTTATNTISASSGSIWNQWVTGTDTSATTSTDNTVWYAWTNGAYRVVRYQYTQPPETEEQKQARLAREAEATRLAEERKRQEAEALQRAEDLLMMHLNAQQLKDWQREKFFEVMSQSGKRFRIRNFGSMNVDEYNPEGKKVASHCIVPSGGRVPLPDQLVMQKLMLEHQEADFMRIANHRVN